MKAVDAFKPTHRIVLGATETAVRLEDDCFYEQAGWKARVPSPWELHRGSLVDVETGEALRDATVLELFQALGDDIHLPSGETVTVDGRAYRVEGAGLVYDGRLQGTLEKL